MSETSFSSPVAEMPPRVSASIHHAYLKKVIPQWLIGATPARLGALKSTSMDVPDWYKRATPAQRQALGKATSACVTSQAAMDKATVDFLAIDAFARPLLVSALKDQFSITLDVDKTFIHLKKPLKFGILEVEVSSFEWLKMPLLQAALHNFEAAECAASAFHSSSGFVVETAQPGAFEAISTSLTVAQFTGLCRSLDIGAKYQAYLKGYLYPAATVSEQALRRTFVAAHKDALRAAAELALLKKDIEPADYSMILSVIDGEVHPWLEGRPVWFRDLSLMKLRMTGCVLFSICAKYRYSDDLILYVPSDPEHPLKRYTVAQLKAQFKRQFTAREPSSSDDDGPSAYQRFFSQFVAYADRPVYFSQFTKDAPDVPLREKITPHLSIANDLLSGLSSVGGFNELPPIARPKQVPHDDPYLDVAYMTRAGQGIWAPNVDLWGYLYDRHRDQIIANAASHAVPTAEVDARVRSRKLSTLLNIGMLVLGGVSMFVPGLGEVMMGVMAGQLLYEVFEGAIEWSEGDRKAAATHLIDVAQNLAVMALMAGAGKGLGKLLAVKAEPVVERLESVTLPNGKVSLWKPDLQSYASDVVLPDDLKPNELGEYELDGNSYILQGHRVYRKQFDPQLNRWRLLHPYDPDAYQPILQHNGKGAWRHSLERPLEWDRQTLLRRMGPDVEPFSSAQLEQIADVSGVSDDALRKMHVDHQAPPPMLAETLKQFRADREVDEMVEDIRNGRCVKGVCEYALPLLVQMPTWPEGEVLEVFRAEPLGESQRYGGESTKPSIKVSHEQLMNGQLPAQVISALDEQQLKHLLGEEAVSHPRRREQLFRDRLATFAAERKRALFESVYRNHATPDPDVERLQRHFPSLPEPAARSVLEHASAAELKALRSTGRIPLRLAQQIRVHVQQAALNRALAGLYLESMASAASDRLALHSLEQLPDWPADVRVEVRADSMAGALLDSIGSEQAPARYVLVKAGDSFQAFDQHGRVLNPKPGVGRNLFESLAAVRPQAVATEPALQQQVASYASSHREQMARLLKLRPIDSGRGPGLRLPSGRLGYLASGRGEGFADAMLISRARMIYPNLSDEQASAFINQLLHGGKTDQQVMHLLNNRRREFDALAADLSRWIAGDQGSRPYGMPSRRIIAERIMAAWREGFDRDLAPATELDLRDADRLAPWEADFSHVRALSVHSEQLLGEEGNDLLARFPGVKRLNITVQEVHLPALRQQLASLSTITELSLDAADVADGSTLFDALHTMPQLQALYLLDWHQPLDLSSLAQLRVLKVRGRMSSWPAGVFDLPQLEALDLRGTAVNTLPEPLFEASEQLLRGLNLDWSQLEPPAFIRIYEHLNSRLPHQIATAKWSEAYCHARLQRLMPTDFTFADAALEQFKTQGFSGRALLDRVADLLQEHAVFNQHMEEWQNRVVQVDRRQVDLYVRKRAAEKIRQCWYRAQRARYAPVEPVPGPSWRTPVLDDVLDLADGPLGDLPSLSGISFDHVRYLDLTGARLATDSVDAFLGRFPNLMRLNLNGNRLTQLPSALDGLVRLEHLQLSRNELSVTPSVQRRLNRLSALTRLDLSYNRVEALDVQQLPALQDLNLSHTAIRTWPSGSLALPSLLRLNLSHSAITEIPEALFNGHEQLLASLQLQGCRLTPAAIQALERTPFELPGGIARARLREGRTGDAPEFFPSEVADDPDLLLPLPLEAPDGDSPTSPALRLQRLDPELTTGEAIRRIDELREQGLGALEMEARLDEWHNTHRQLVASLNDWIDVRAYREGDDWITAVQRRRAADRILACWRQGLHAPVAAGPFELDISQLDIGDLPQLPVALDRVGTLNVSSTRMTAQNSNGFFRSFTRLEHLMINGNALVALPESLSQCESITRLDAHYNDFRDSGSLHAQLTRFRHLEQLDLGNNTLATFSVTGLDRLHTLDLRGNLLDEWPEGVLEAPALTRLNLSNNQIDTIPGDALLPAYDRLIAGTDVSDNLLLEEDFRRLRDHLEETGRGLGFSLEEIDRSLEGYVLTDDESEGSSDDEAHPGDETLEEQKPRWFDGVAADSEKHQVWERLTAEEGGADFFNVLSQLRHTEDFVRDRGDLVRRVWQVLQAANDSEPLRDELFSLARTLRVRETCGDGRILLFNDLEIKAYEFEALKSVEPEHKGRELLKLSRGLFRLGKVEDIARAAIQRRPRIDPAEIRLAYRIGLAERLGLPRQPKSMIYANLAQVTARDLDEAYVAILQAQGQPEFVEQLLGRSYWMDYLEEQYADEFTQLQQRFEAGSEALEEQYPDFDAAYFKALETLDTTRKTERRQLALRLSRQELGQPPA
ncbi:NEL-type E3 ubiquitin ligase domain-containing protein [Pseudomonas sp. S35]|uniref:NEL-type E3 ubiquitin ligase domain-containing protein n=1 Tax=Pseudomonas sp. S35 TaxID=1573719 RepID=UPI00135B904C|nr:NEL-type E3 ubiquitin ligase domain-containing protein [Pseudomonas sp. S35]